MRKKLGRTLTMAALLSFAVGGAALAADQVLYRKTFEADNGGFTFTGPWQWGSVTMGTDDGAPEGSYSGVKCIGTGLDEVATEGGEAISGPITIPALGTGQFAVLSYYAFTNIDMDDRGRMYISDDNGATWYKISTHYMNETTYDPTIFYASDSSYVAHPNQWRKFTYDISAWAGNNVKIKFQLADGEYMPGYYIDDLTVTLSTVGAVNKVTLTLEAAEDPEGSCPWLQTWDGESFKRDNDIYSVARYPRGEYRDFYKVEKQLALVDSTYRLQVKEIDDEISYTDYVDLWAVDHAADVAVGVDMAGGVHAYKPAELAAPVAATSKSGANATALVSGKNSEGYAAYSEDWLDVDFGVLAAGSAKNLVLRVKGFQSGQEPAMPFIGPPAVVVKAFEGGVWVEKGRLKPRFQWSENVFDLSAVAPGEDGHFRVRVESISHGHKYNEIDLVGLFVGTEPAFTLSDLSLLNASGSWGDALPALLAADNSYHRMEAGEAYEMSFSGAAQNGAARDFIFISEGYYVPANTIYVYTWDGANWVRRDGRSFIDEEESFQDLTYDIDLSMHLPDPDGEYKVRLWNNFAGHYGEANLDFARMKVKPIGQEEITGAILGAKDVRYPDDEYLSGVIKDLNEASDNDFYDLGLEGNGFEGWSSYDAYFNSSLGKGTVRSNWIEVEFSDLPANSPPMIKSITIRGKKIIWTTEDGDEGDSQQFFAAEIWTEPGGNGDIVWNPPTFDSSSGQLTLPTDLVPGQTYFIRLRASDGKTWGNWTEYEFVAPDVSALKLHDEQINFGCFIDSLTR